MNLSHQVVSTSTHVEWSISRSSRGIPRIPRETNIVWAHLEVRTTRVAHKPSGDDHLTTWVLHSPHHPVCFPARPQVSTYHQDSRFCQSQPEWKCCTLSESSARSQPCLVSCISLGVLNHLSRFGVNHGSKRFLINIIRTMPAWRSASTHVEWAFSRSSRGKRRIPRLEEYEHHTTRAQHTKPRGHEHLTSRAQHLDRGGNEHVTV